MQETDMRGGFHPDQVMLARAFSSVLLFGPPMSHDLIELVAHLFSPDEARLAMHLPYYIPRSLKTIARRYGQPAGATASILEPMADRRVIYRSGTGKYALLPLLPGIFEYVLMGGGDSPWHRKYGRLINRLFATGYIARYTTTRSPIIRNIPVQKAVENKSRIMDADLISKMIESHKIMGVLNVCQCRQSAAFEGKSCRRSKPEDGCLVFGSFAESIIEKGVGRSVTREEMHRIVQQRWDNSLVFMTANIIPSKSNAICTCCDCCCHYIESINMFKGGVSLAEPHFIALVDEEHCTGCSKCTKVCNTHAHEIISGGHRYLPEKCIGCGLCVEVCPKKVISLKENRNYDPPSRSWKIFGIRVVPSIMLAMARAFFSKEPKPGADEPG